MSVRSVRSSFFYVASLLAAVSVLVAVGACSNPPNTQLLPIGSRCTSDSECGTSPYVCEKADPQKLPYPNGYCDKTCSTTGDCPSDSVCYMSHCLRTCAATADCRQAEGYTCRPAGATGAELPFCDVPEGS